MLSKGRAKEGQNIFASGSMAGVAISLLIKNPNGKEHGKIFYHDIGDDLSQKDKLTTLSSYGCVNGIADWRLISPDIHGDWLNQRDNSFGGFIVLGDKKTDQSKLFDNYSLGVVTNRDAWAYNASKTTLESNMSQMIDFYNAEVGRFSQTYPGLDKKARDAAVDGFINTDPERISWTYNVKQELAKGRTLIYDASSLVPSLYRPFTKQWMYYSRQFNERVYQMPRIFPNADVENLVIQLAGVGARSGFSVMITNRLPSLDTIEKGQCFPLYLYGEAAPKSNNQTLLPDQGSGELQRRDAITDEGLEHFQQTYPSEEINKEDVFYYVYGLLHSEDYREKYADNLSKQLPRIPRVKTATDFWAFSKTGRSLAELHLNYESVAMYPATIVSSGMSDEDYRVEKMKYGAKKDLTTLHYNSKITVKGIPLEAYDYVVNGKPALDWVVERQCVKADKASGIVNDANDWAIETMQNPKYPLELFLRVITVSLETMKIVRNLPRLELLEE